MAEPTSFEASRCGTPWDFGKLLTVSSLSRSVRPGSRTVPVWVVVLTILLAQAGIVWFFAAYVLPHPI